MPATTPLPLSFDEPLGQKIIELHVWAVSKGLDGTEASPLFDGLCQRLVDAGVPLWRAFAGMDFTVATPTDEQALDFGLMGPQSNYGKAAQRTEIGKGVGIDVTRFGEDVRGKKHG